MINFTLQELQRLKRIITKEVIDDDCKVLYSILDKVDFSLNEELEWDNARKVEFKFASPVEYNLKSLPDAPEGTYLTFIYQANSNVKVQCKTPPEENLKLWTRESYSHCSTALKPVAMYMKISETTWNLLVSNVIPNHLFPVYGNCAIFNTVSETAYFDYGYRNPRE